MTEPEKTITIKEKREVFLVGQNHQTVKIQTNENGVELTTLLVNNVTIATLDREKIQNLIVLLSAAKEMVKK